MTNLRKYGNPPFHVAVLHGGPGAPGSVAPVARELACDRGVLEPLQTADSVEGQVEELRDALLRNGRAPFTLIGSSWGAMLGFIFAARHPDLAGKLILVGSAPFEERYAAGIMPTRLSRLSESEREEIHALMQATGDPANRGNSAILARIGALCAKADAYDPLPGEINEIEVQIDIHNRVWNEARKLRADGTLLALAAHIACPVLAIHGDHDPHPADGVREPLSAMVKDFRFILLNRCGHEPWIEKYAKDAFFAILRSEL